MRPALVAAILLAGSADAMAAAATQSDRARAAYGRLPLSFEANQGQTDPRVKFLSRGRAHTLFLTADGAVLELRGAGDARASVRTKLRGANPGAVATGVDELPGKSHYLRGSDPRSWRTNVPNYRKVRLRAVYPGIDLVYYGNQRELEYDFVLAPGADPRTIRMEIDGARSLRVDAAGDLVLEVDEGELRYRRPVVYQEIGGTRRLVDGRYLVVGREVRFAVGPYDRARPLVIDPVLDYYSTYLGGSWDDLGQGIAVGEDGSAYIAGETSSLDFPIVNAFQPGPGGSRDAFVTKLNPAGTALIFSTYLGGSGDDSAVSVAVGPAGDIYLGGRTTSDDFPIAVPAQAVRGGGVDAFVARLTASGTGVLFSTYLGGLDDDFATGIAVDGDGFAYLSGYTSSFDFPLAGGSPQPFNRGGVDGFVTKLTEAGGLFYSTYLGGSDADYLNAITVDASRTVYVAGTSRSFDFPLVDPAQMYFGGDDAVLAKINAAGTAFSYATYLGGTGNDRATAIAVDRFGNMFVTGDTDSLDFPVANPARGTKAAGLDAFVTKLNAAGNSLVYSTYLGGNDYDTATGIAVDLSGFAYVTGWTRSADFPTADAVQGPRGAADAFVTKLADGFSLLFSTYLGGSAADLAFGIAVDGAGDAYVTGYTGSADFLLVAPMQPAPGGNNDAFVTKLHIPTVHIFSDSGQGSLRDAIERANQGGVARITFSHEFAGTTIDLFSPLPAITRDGTIIDGDANADCLPDVELNGGAVGGNGLWVQASNTTVRGLTINRFGGNGIVVSGGAGNRIECNHVGTDRAGTADRGNASSGVAVANGALHSVIGPNNVIAFNRGLGVAGGVLVMDGANTGAYPAFSGLTPDFTGIFPVIDFPGTRGPFRSADGITPVDGGGHPFGDTFGARFTGSLTVSTTGTYQFTVTHPDDKVRVLVGGLQVLDVQCCGDPPPASKGLEAGSYPIEVDYFDGAGGAGFALAITGPGSATLSTGAQPGLTGEFFQLRIPTEFNTITQNSVFANGGLGIELDAVEDGNGVNPNDAGDGDIGPNTALNHPVFTSVTGSGGNVNVQGTAPPASVVEIFAADPDPSGHGEGKVFLTAAESTATGDFSATVTLPAGYTSLTATATDDAGNTSEFGPTAAPSRWTQASIFGDAIPDISSPSGYAAGDLDGDGDLDLFAAGAESGGTCRLLILKQVDGAYPNGQFNEALGLCGGNDGLALGDVNGDGWLDIVAEGRDNSDITRLRVLLNRGPGGGFTFPTQALEVRTPGLVGGSVALGDIDGDGDLDLAATGEEPDGTRRFMIFKNDGSGVFTLAQEPWGAGSGFAAGSSLSFGDVDSDGDLDLVVGGQTNDRGQGLNVFTNNRGTFTWTQEVMPQGFGVLNGHSALADTDQDGDLDLVVAGSTWDGSQAHKKLMHFRNDAGIFHLQADLTEIASFGSWGGVALGDADGDGFPDLFASGHDGSNFRLFYFSGSATGFIAAEEPPASFTGRVLFGDFDDDGDLDMVGLPVRHLYTNAAGPANAPPTAPTTVAATINARGEVELSWTGETDAETAAAALSYQVRVGTTPGIFDVISGAYGTPFLGTHPMGRLSPGRPGLRLRLPPGPYTWQVRAIDSGLAAGPWTGENGFVSPQTVSIDDVTVTEGNGGTTNAVFTVTVSGPIDADASVDFRALDGTATASSDYVPNSGTITFTPGGPVTQTISVQVNGDTVGEAASESFFVDLSNPVNVGIADERGVGTIVDDDAPGITVADVSVPEGNLGSRSVYVLATLSRPSEQTITISYATENGSATAGSDYQSVSGTLTFSPGSRSATVAINVFGDTAAEGNETFFVDLSNPVNGTLVRGQATFTILDDEGAARAQTKAVWRKAREGMPSFHGSAFGANRYVLVGDYGEIWSSPDGTAWTRQTNPDPDRRSLWDVVHTGDQFVAVGRWCCGPSGSQYPVVLTSTDGQSWTARDMRGTGAGQRDLFSVAYGNGVHVAVGSQGTVITSADAVSWTLQPSATGEWLSGVAFGAGVFVAVGDSRTVLTSPDGTNWTPQAGVPGDIGSLLKKVTYTGTQFVVAANGGGGVITSPDGVTWTRRPAPGGAAPDLHDVYFSPSPFELVIAVGGGTVITSPDAIAWTKQNTTDVAGASVDFNTVTWGPFGFVAAGFQGALQTSGDGLTWTARTLTASRTYFGMAHDGGQFCAVGGHGAIASSPDGVTWTDQTSTIQNWWRSVVFANGLFVAVGDGAEIATSPDCATWTERNRGSTSGPETGITGNLWDVAFGNGVYVAVGWENPAGGGVTPQVVTSPDGVGWTTRESGLPAGYSVESVAFGNGQFVAFAVRNDTGATSIVTSADAVTWTAHETPFAVYEDLWDITYDDGVFTAVGGRIWTSANGIDWTLRRDWGPFLRSVASGGGRLVAVGDNGAVVGSADGSSWVANTSATSWSQYGVAYSSAMGRFAAVGDSVITYTDGFEPPALTIGDATVPEGGSAVFTVLLSATASEAVSVDFTTEDFTATAGSDYQSTSGSLTIPAGAMTATITVPVFADAASENNERFLVRLTTAAGATIADAVAVGTITDDDPLAVSISDASVTEGQTGAVTASFLVSLSRVNSTQTVTVAYATADGTATTGGNDYSSQSGTVNFSPGSRIQTINITVNGDLLVEGNETFSINLSNPTNGVIARAQGIGTILDDEGAAPAPTRSTWRVGQEGMPTLRAAAASGSTYVAVGDFGGIWTSPDGLAWTQRPDPDPTLLGLRGVVFGGNQFVAVGECCVPFGGGVVLTSPDGATWTQRLVPTLQSDQGFNAVAHSGTLYVAVGNGGKVVTSPDGVTWTERSTPTSQTLNGVAFGAGAFVAVGSSGTVLASTDGSTWTPMTGFAVSANLNAITYDGTRFVAVGNNGTMITSIDGTSWTDRLAGPFHLKGVSSGGGLLVAVGINNIVTSTDGDSWSLATVVDPGPGVSRNFNAVTFGAAGFVATGTSGALYTSPDGTTSWVSHTLSTSRFFRAVANDGGGYCAVGDFGAVASSAEGVIWTNQVGLPAPFGPGTFDSWFGLARGTGQFVAVGDRSSIMTSPDCASWTDRNPSRVPPGANGFGSFNDVTFGNGLFVAVGRQTPSGSPTEIPMIVTSADGVTWTQRSSGMLAEGGRRLNAVAFGAARFVAIGGPGGGGSGEAFVLHSPDGVSWTESPVTSLGTDSLSDIAYGAGVFVAAGGRLWSSPDGIDWTLRVGGTSFTGVTYAGGRFVAVGPRGVVFESVDGIDWSRNASATVHALTSVDFLGNRFVAVGDSTMVYTEGDEAPRMVIADAAVVEGNAGATNAVFTVALTSTSPSTVTVDYTTEDLTATAGSDYEAASGRITFEPGTASATITVPVIGDTASENHETFLVRLSAPTNATLADALALGTITDDDPIAISISDASVTEGHSGGTTATFIVSLSRVSTQSVTVNYTTADGTATTGSNDYVSQSGTRTFNPGTRTQTINITVNGDVRVEGDETLFVNLGNPVNAVIGDSQGAGTIVDDEAVVPPPARQAWKLAQEGMPALRASAASPSTYVVVGDFGHIWSSTDAVSWTRRTNPDTTLRGLRGLAFANGQFVAVGECCTQSSGAAVLTSPDGQGWTRRILPTSVNQTLNAVAFGSGTTWVAVGFSGKLVRSVDNGVSWTEQTTPTTATLNGVAFGGSPATFVAVGNGGTVLTSSNGTTWTAAATGTIPLSGNLNAITYTGSQFVVVGGSGGVMTSTDGLAWTQRSTGTGFTLFGVTSTGSLIAAAGGPIVLTSTDGAATWTTTTLADAGPGIGRSLNTITGGPTGFLAAGTAGALYTSPDAASEWVSGTFTTSRSFRAVVHGAGIYCAVGDTGTVATSADGTTWTNQVGLPPPARSGGVIFGPGSHDNWRSVTFGGSRFVAVGAFSAIMTSADCVSWTDQNPTRLSPAGSGGNYNDIAYGNGLYVAVGTLGGVAGIATSTDGTAWKQRRSGMAVDAQRSLSAVAYGNGRFVAIGRNTATSEALVLTSDDGETWTERPAPILDRDSFSDLAYGNGVFVAAGSKLWASPDGITWTLAVGGTSFTGVTYGSGRFVAVGGRGVVFSSLDGTTWLSNTSATVHGLNSVAYDPAADRFVAVGDSAMVYTDGFEAPRVAIRDATVTEGDTGTSNAEFPVILSSTSTQAVIVGYTTANDTAAAGTDFTSTTGTLTFPPGSGIQTIQVPIIGDTVGERDEDFFVLLTNPIGATIADGLAFGFILDNDAPSITVTDRTVTEGDTGTVTALFNVLLSKPSTQTVTVNYGTTPGTATAGTDYVPVSGTLTFPPGSTARVVGVSVKGDHAVEGDETFFFDVSSPTNAAILDAQGRATIVDDEGSPRPIWRKALDGMPNLRGAAFGASTYVAVGDFGDIWTSPDTVNWTSRGPSALFRVLNAVTYGGGQFVAVGGGVVTGEVMTSPDGVTWTVQDAASALEGQSLLAVTHGNGLYVAVGNAGRIITSSDAVTWTARASGVSAPLNGVAFGGGVFVAVGANRTVLTSADGVTWSVQAAIPGGILNLNAVTYGGGQFVAVGSGGGIVTSPDGVTWTRQASPTGAQFFGVAWAGGVFVAAGGGFVVSSADGITWTTRTLASTGGGIVRNIRAVTFGDNGFLAVSFGGGLFTSPNGTATWASQTLAASRQFRSLARDATRFCAVGNNGSVASSPDGVTWTNQTGIADALTNSWNGLTYANGLFVAVGNLGEVMTSPDCVTWTERNAGRLVANPDTGITGFLSSVTFGNGLFVAVGEEPQNAGPTIGLIATSPDGTTWTQRDSSVPPDVGASFDAVAYGNGRFVVAGLRIDGGTNVVTSEDGINWSSLGSPFGRDFVGDIVYANGMFVAVGGRIWTSTDGITWTLRQDYRNLNRVAFGNGRFTATGNLGVILVSTDGIEWMQVASPTGHSLFGVAYAPAPLDRFVAVGDGVAAYSDGDEVVTVEASIDDVTLAEGDAGTTNAVFTVTLSQASTRDVTIDYTTADLSAVAGADYQPTTGTLTIPAGALTGNIVVPVLGDVLDEFDEVFAVILSGATEATIVDSQGRGTIANDDTPPAISIEGTIPAEGDSGTTPAVFTVRLSAPSGKMVQVDFATADGTATAGEDYVHSDGTLTFPIGATEATITVDILGDTIYEGSETFFLNLSNPQNATLAPKP